jgi:hypothetical protein
MELAIHSDLGGRYFMHTFKYNLTKFCFDYEPSQKKICEKQLGCIHINKDCPKQEYLKACYPDDERLKTV